LDCAIDLASKDYPAMLDTENPGFPKLLEDAVQRARKQSSVVKDFGGYAAVLKRFADSFQDEHFRVGFNLQPVRVDWGQFLIGFQDGKYIVQYSETPDVKLGSVVSACDGVSPETWMRDDILPYEQGVPSLEADLARDAPWMLVDQKNPFTPRPSECVVDGKDLKLSWQSISYSQIRENINSVVLGSYKPKFAYRDFAKNGVWVQLPTFRPRTEKDAEAFREIIGRAPQFREKGIIVIDVRRNGGGNSQWFMDFLSSLYGDEMVRYYARQKPTLEREYVVTPDIAEYYQKQVEEAVRQFGSASQETNDAHSTADHIRQALAQGEKTYLEPSEQSKEPPPPQYAPKNPVRAKVYVLTDYGCGSACLSFLDEIRNFPNVTQVGLPTHADRPYTNPMSVELPSGIATVSCATMIRRKRVRGANEPWVPKYRFSGDIGDTAKVEQWILDLDKGR
jgi:hypothetical protein